MGLGAAASARSLPPIGSCAASVLPIWLPSILQAAATGLEPKQPYVLALSGDPHGGGALESLAAFMSNPAGAAIVNAVEMNHTERTRRMGALRDAVARSDVRGWADRFLEDLAGGS